MNQWLGPRPRSPNQFDEIGGLPQSALNAEIWLLGVAYTVHIDWRLDPSAITSNEGQVEPFVD